jgi:hypothetical protein
MLWLLSGKNGARVDKASLFFLLFFAAARALLLTSQKLQRGFRIVENKRICARKMPSTSNVDCASSSRAF